MIELDELDAAVAASRMRVAADIGGHVVPHNDRSWHRVGATANPDAVTVGELVVFGSEAGNALELNSAMVNDLRQAQLLEHGVAHGHLGALHGVLDTFAGVLHASVVKRHSLGGGDLDRRHRWIRRTVTAAQRDS